jgi:hypothetical protein
MTLGLSNAAANYHLLRVDSVESNTYDQHGLMIFGGRKAQHHQSRDSSELIT